MKSVLEEMLHETQGITMIALVVTIVILLILAGITIGTITGNDGLIGKTEEAKREHEIASWEERIDTAIIQVEGSKRNPTIDDIIQGLIDKEIISNESKVNRETGVIETNDPVYEIPGKLDDYMGVTAETIANAENKENYYGKIVENYECPNGEGVNNWLIFYADENNIYLITDDYIHKDYCPESKGGNELSQEEYEFSFHYVMKDYNGSNDITNEKLKMLNNKYFEYLRENQEVNSEDNMKAVAYMLDTEAWSGFKGSKAEYAIGGPTLELLFNSYNQKYKNNNLYQTRVESKFGYEISSDRGNKFDTRTEVPLEENDKLYVISDHNKANGMWIASPSNKPYSAGGYLDLYDLGYYGNVTSATWNTLLGFRPLVCLKSDVVLKKQENGNYIIK